MNDLARARRLAEQPIRIVSSHEHHAPLLKRTPVARSAWVQAGARGSATGKRGTQESFASLLTSLRDFQLQRSGARPKGGDPMVQADVNTGPEHRSYSVEFHRAMSELSSNGVD